VIYWALLLGGQTLGTRLSWSPFWSTWAPNALVLAAGLALWAARLRTR
jgi:lipopolysaccharide export system permease protein